MDRSKEQLLLQRAPEVPGKVLLSSTWAHWLALISISMALSQTATYTEIMDTTTKPTNDRNTCNKNKQTQPTHTGILMGIFQVYWICQYMALHKVSKKPLETASSVPLQTGRSSRSQDAENIEYHHNRKEIILINIK